MDNYIVCGVKRWCRDTFNNVICHFPGKWTLFDEYNSLTYDKIQSINPKYLFFLHWSKMVSKEITSDYECICFHMTDLPYGRGGSPLQNLIIRGHENTCVTALRMTEEVDAGPIYLKKVIGLNGTATEIFKRAGAAVASMIKVLIENDIVPAQQSGPPTFFVRRTPQQSDLTTAGSQLKSLYDHIRMLDSDDYPRAYLDYGPFRYTFKNAHFTEDELHAEVVISNSKRGAE